MSKQQPDALRLANVCSNLTRYSMDAHLIAAELLRLHAYCQELESQPNYLKELAMCRGVFDIPPPEDKLEAEWVAAMVSPEAVPLYVEARRRDYINKLDAKDEEIRVLSAKIVDQQNILQI